MVRIDLPVISIFDQCTDNDLGGVFIRQIRLTLQSKSVIGKRVHL